MCSQSDFDAYLNLVELLLLVLPRALAPEPLRGLFAPWVTSAGAHLVKLIDDQPLLSGANVRTHAWLDVDVGVAYAQRVTCTVVV